MRRPIGPFQGLCSSQLWSAQQGAAPLALAGVLVDDVRGDGLLLLLLLPHQQDALVDEDVLLLHTGGTQARSDGPAATLHASRG